MKTITITKVLSIGFSMRQIRAAEKRGLLTVAQRGGKRCPTLLDATSPYLSKFDQNKVSL
ncbi:TPA: hypothetical protein I9Y90_000073 [Elizabethkingia anophelis]|nr:hypothetical protein [Elizabethkingia anophelis]HAT4009596.1 hypothetical protein [Elizabethkingia anophelis]